MEELFATVFDMSVTATVVILVILVLRVLLARAPKKYSYYLWAVAAFRLICPVSISSVFSLFNLPVNRVQENTVITMPKENIVPAIPDNTTTVAPQYTVTVTTPTVNVINWAEILSYVWIVGIVVVLLVTLIQVVRLRSKTRFAVRLEGNIWQSESIPGPFVLGLIRPKIFLPVWLQEGQKEHVLAHERYHIRRGDHWVKAGCQIILAIHWFNPFVWLMMWAVDRDMELSCDEGALKHLGEDKREGYSRTLLSLAVSRRAVGPVLAFGAPAVKKRILHALGYHKAAKVTVAFAMVVLLIAGLTCCTDGIPRSAPPSESGADVSGDTSADYVVKEDTQVQEAYQLEVDLQTNEMKAIPTLRLYSDGTYIFNLSMTSSHFCTGTWTEADSVITLTEENIQRQFRRIDDSTLEYMGNGSEGHGQVPKFDIVFGDGAIFRRILDLGNAIITDPILVSNGTRYEVQGLDVDYLEVTPTRGNDMGSIYFVNPTFLGAYFVGKHVEGSAWWTDESATDITVAFTQSAGVSNGTLTGPTLLFTLNLGNGDLSEINSTPYNVTGETVTMTEDEMKVTGAMLASLMQMADSAVVQGESPEVIGDTPTPTFFDDMGIRVLLSSEYDSPRQIDLYELFYNGARDDGYELATGLTLDRGNDISEEERTLLEQAGCQIDLDIVRVRRTDMDAILRFRTGYGLDEMEGIGLDKLVYLEEYDAYYDCHGDTNLLTDLQLVDQRVNEDGSVTYCYTSAEHSGEITFAPETNHVLSNRYVENGD